MTADDPGPQDPRQLQLRIDVPDTRDLDEIKHVIYDQLIHNLGRPSHCLPDRGVHVYLDHRGTGPCQCASTSKNTKKGAS